MSLCFREILVDVLVQDGFLIPTAEQLESIDIDPSGTHTHLLELNRDISCIKILFFILIQQTLHCLRKFYMSLLFY